MFIIEEVYLENRKKREELKQFLSKFNLEFENDIDFSIAVYNSGKIIATASKTKNVLKCFAVDEVYQGLGLTNSLVKKIEDRMFLESLYHFFIFTPSYNKKIFMNVGYKEVITSNEVTILENGNLSIDSYLKQRKLNNNITETENGCIIINGNPFTLGHLYLIEEAAKKVINLLIFVVTEDKSSFPFSVRYRLIKQGVKHLNNVSVLETGPYLISNATFPTYFLKKNIDVVKLQSEIDCDIFIKFYKPYFNISKRFVGTEPYCEVTNTYNKVMKEVLPKNGVEVIEIKRKEVNNESISASIVRKLLKEDKIDLVASLVPKSTFEFLVSDEAKVIINNLKLNQSRH